MMEFSWLVDLSWFVLSCSISIALLLFVYGLIWGDVV